MSFLVFTWWIEYSQGVYAKSYKDHAIEMSDFTIRVKNIPHHDQYGKDDEILRGHLMEHFQKIIQDQVRKNAGQEGLYLEDQELLEVADVCFGKSDMDEVDYLSKLTNYRNEYKKIEIKLKNPSLPKHSRKELRQEQEKLKAMFKKKRESFVRHCHPEELGPDAA